MIPVRRTIELKEGGVTVDLLVTPHLYSYKDRFGVSFDTNLEDARQVMDNYSDVFFLAAVNAWELDGKGTAEDFPHTRGDFHAWAAGCPEEFGKCIKFAIPALTGKTAGELVAERKGKEAGNEAEGLKKKRSSWIGRLLKRFS